jgi:hypothetical protein
MRRGSITIVKTLTAGLLLHLSAFNSPDVALADDVFISQEIKNGLTGTTVNDLRVKFTQPLHKEAIGFTLPTLKKPDGTGQVMASAVSDDGLTATFNAGNVPGGSIAPGAPVIVRFFAPEGTKVAKEASVWTVDSEAFADSVAMVGQAPNLFFSEGFAFAQFVNPEPFDVTYSEIQLFRDNSIANFNIDEFDIPTGELVAGIPSSITLGSGEIAELLPFGTVDPLKYQLALANAAAVSTPSIGLPHVQADRLDAGDLVRRQAREVAFQAGLFAVLREVFDGRLVQVADEREVLVPLGEDLYSAIHGVPG